MEEEEYLIRKNDLLQVNNRAEDESYFSEKNSETNIDDGRGEINPKLVNEV
jgi:hypothetical protein